MSDFTWDRDRAARVGTPEIIYGEHKNIEQLERILEIHRKAGHSALITRLDDKKAKALLRLQENAEYDSVGRTLTLRCQPPPRRPGCVSIVSAGTSDAPVVREAEATLHFLGVPAQSFNDVGVAGVHRLQERLGELAKSDVLICVAGFEGALASVLTGLVRQPVIGVPTSVGYGVATGGHAALHAMLASCANGLMVMNIDNGCGAALAACRILNRIYKGA